MTLAELIYVWGMSAVVLTMPTVLIVMWALCRMPAKTQTAPEAAMTPPQQSTQRASEAGRGADLQVRASTSPSRGHLAPANPVSRSNQRGA